MVSPAASRDAIAINQVAAPAFGRNWVGKVSRRILVRSTCGVERAPGEGFGGTAGAVRPSEGLSALVGSRKESFLSSRTTPGRFWSTPKARKCYPLR